jgi:16S rRNA G966 N2-methylase RsmD
MAVLEEQLRGLEPMLSEVKGKTVLDIGCAEGLIAREVLERGAAKVIFIDSKQPCVDAVKETDEAFGFEKERMEVWKADIHRGVANLASRGVKLDLVYVDPPYEAGLNKPALEALVSQKVLADHDRVRVLLEHSSDLEAPQVPGLALYRQYRHGAATVSAYGKEGETLAVQL